MPGNVPGENLPKVKHYYTEFVTYFGMDIVVVGSANSAVGGSRNLQKGAKSVTMIIREKEIGSNADIGPKPDIINRIEEGSIKAIFNASILVMKKEFLFISRIQKLLQNCNDLF